MAIILTKGEQLQIPDNFPYSITIHAEKVISAREIPLEWILRVLIEPQRTEPDDADPELCHALRRIPEFGDRVLRVVYNQTTNPWRIITVYFDRTQRNRL